MSTTMIGSSAKTLREEAAFGRVDWGGRGGVTLINSLPAEMNEVIYFCVVELNSRYHVIRT